MTLKRYLHMCYHSKHAIHVTDRILIEALITVGYVNKNLSQ